MLEPNPAHTDDDRSAWSPALRAGSVVLTHHWLVRRRGGEKVLEALCELAPGAPIYTLVHEQRLKLQLSAPHDIHTSILQRLPAASRWYPAMAPLMPWAARRVRLPRAELVLCSDAALAKAFTPHADSKVVCYCHSPMRYAWDQAEFHRTSLPALARPLFDRLVRRLRAADLEAAGRVDYFIANSRHVAERIQRNYGRESEVIYPPVDMPERMPDSSGRGEHFLCVGYHTPYKRLDLAIACSQALRRPLRVVGDGPDVRRFQRQKLEHVEFLGWLPDDALGREYLSAAALLFPGEEDFGIVPVEATAHGCPVIAYGVGGAAETIIEGLNGALFPDQSADSLVAAARRQLQRTPAPMGMFQHAQRFSRPRFLREIHAFVTGKL